MLYFKQFLLLNDLLIIICFVDAILLLFKNIIIENYQKSKMIINLSFATRKIVDKFIFYKIIHKMKNLFNHLFIDINFDLKTQKKLKRRFKHN